MSNLEDAKSSPEAVQESGAVHFPVFLGTVLISGAVILTVLFAIIRTPTIAEKIKLILPLTPSIIAETGSIPARVNAGLRINNMREFDFINNKFAFDGIVWFVFDPAIVSLDTISNFAFERAEIKSKSAPETRELENGKLFVRFDIVVQFLPQLDFIIFPVDDHAISLVLFNNKASVHELIFESSNIDLIVAADTTSVGWQKSYQDVITGYIAGDIKVQAETQKMSHPAAEFTLYYQRVSIKYPAILILPMFILMMIMLSTFCYDPNKYFSAIMAANGASLTGLIGFRFVIENSSPRVGYFVLSDYIFIAFVILAALIFLVGVFLGKLSLRTKYILVIAIHTAIIGTFLVVLKKGLSYRVYFGNMTIEETRSMS